ncbi:MAG TPA: hypothetical protein PKZ61_17810 [Thermoflexales bacterium]|mgnify:FL=1|jgi:hypothetical protein|nr:hypothetical protein [Thermoflexales bacterium]
MNSINVSPCDFGAPLLVAFGTSTAIAALLWLRVILAAQVARGRPFLGDNKQSAIKILLEAVVFVSRDYMKPGWPAGCVTVANAFFALIGTTFLVELVIGCVLN